MYMYIQVTLLQKNSGVPPAQVKWASGFTYWVHWEDLVREEGTSAAKTSAAKTSAGAVPVEMVKIVEKLRLPTPQQTQHMQPSPPLQLTALDSTVSDSYIVSPKFCLIHLYIYICIYIYIATYISLYLYLYI